MRGYELFAVGFAAGFAIPGMFWARKLRKQRLALEAETKKLRDLISFRNYLDRQLDSSAGVAKTSKNTLR